MTRPSREFFPAAQLDHMVSLARRQKNLAGPNIILSDSARGCGRDLTPACLHGHLILEEPQCPILWAIRLQREGRETGFDIDLPICHLNNMVPLARRHQACFPRSDTVARNGTPCKCSNVPSRPALRTRLCPFHEA